jgi:hypothetical protein
MPGSAMPPIRFNLFSVNPPGGWVDVTYSLDVVTPPVTLARPGGVGALQFSVAAYSGGERPDPSPDQLLGMLEGFGESRGLGAPQAAVATRAGRLRLAAASFRSEGDFVRVWSVSDGLNFALVTYVCEAGRESEELADCERIVRSLAFTDPR